MRISLDWLTDYVSLRASTTEVVDKLTLRTAEVEEVINPPRPILEAVPARIITVAPHPHADRLTLVTVKTAQGEKKVVCGAPNLKVGAFVPYLSAGSHYCTPNGEEETLKTATIRGVKSAGMLASARDLGLGNEHEGLLILPAETKLESKVAKLIGWEKPLLDLEITPNRGDLLSYIGLARELALIEHTRLNVPSISGIAIAPQDNKPVTKPEIESVNCLRYTTVTLTGLQNLPTPAWIANRLRLNGFIPKNAIVDVTNYVMLETGQPLHAFDWKKLHLTKGVADVTVRQARDQESFTALDAQTYKLTKGDLVISNGNQAIALAGVIGGQSAEIDSTTETVVLESAVFDPVSTRKTAQRLGLRTEAVTRFEKGIDPELSVIALKRAVALLLEISGGRAVGRMYDGLNGISREKKRLVVSLERGQRVLGFKIDRALARDGLSVLGFQVSPVGQNSQAIIVPSWRLDIEREEDIFEELARIYGYDKLPTTIPSGPITPVSQTSVFADEDKLRRLLVRSGARDLINQAFMSGDLLGRYRIFPKNCVAIANPTTKNEQYGRRYLVPILTERLLRLSREHASLASFEIGHVFSRVGDKIKEDDHLGLAYLTAKPQKVASKIKFLLERLPQTLERKGEITFVAGQGAEYWANPVEEIHYQGKRIGTLGVIAAEIAHQGKLRGERFLVAAEIDLEPLLAAERAVPQYQKPSRYPAIVRDLTIKIAETANIREEIEAIHHKKLPDLAKIDLISIFDQDDQRAVTLRLTFQSSTTTLQEAIINEELKKITPTA